MREWLVYVAIMAVLFVLVFNDSGLVGILAGLLVSGPLYLGFGYVMAKFGYRRKSWSELRAESKGRPSTRGGSSAPAGSADPRRKPAPTSRTGGAPARSTAKRRKQRR